MKNVRATVRTVVSAAATCCANLEAGRRQYPVAKEVADRDSIIGESLAVQPIVFCLAPLLFVTYR